MEHVKAFIAAQGDLGAALKTAKNPFLKNDYAPLDQVQDAVIPVFGKHGFAVIQLGGSDDCGQYIDTRLDHESGSGYCCRIYLQFKAGDMQSLGSAITYARRYGLSQLAGVISGDKDDDGEASLNPVARECKRYKAEVPFKDITHAQRNLLERAEVTENWLINGVKTQEKFDEGFDKAKTMITQLNDFAKPVANELAVAFTNHKLAKENNEREEV